MKNLEGDQSIVLEISREIDGRHPAAAELPLEEVAISKSILESGVDFDHQSCSSAMAKPLSPATEYSRYVFRSSRKIAGSRSWRTRPGASSGCDTSNGRSAPS